MMTIFETVLISLVLCINFIHISDGQTCDKKNQFGNCAKLSCPERNGTICEKRRCVNNDDQATRKVATISSIVVAVLVLMVIIIVGTVMWIRSRRIFRQSGDSSDRKLSAPSVKNSYSFHSNPPSTMTGVTNSAFNNRHPPLPPCYDEDENPYEYETVDFTELASKSQATNPTVGETENGYLIPTPLTKPNLPPPKISDLAHSARDQH